MFLFPFFISLFKCVTASELDTQTESGRDTHTHEERGVREREITYVLLQLSIDPTLNILISHYELFSSWFVSQDLMKTKPSKAEVCYQNIWRSMSHSSRYIERVKDRGRIISIHIDPKRANSSCLLCFVHVYIICLCICLCIYGMCTCDRVGWRIIYELKERGG